MGPRAAAKARLEDLERERHRMTLANRYIRNHRPQKLAELGYTAPEIRQLIQTGGHPNSAFVNIRQRVHYFKVKSRRRLWLPDPGEP